MYFILSYNMVCYMMEKRGVLKVIKLLGIKQNKIFKD
jgi:hypothetical protein